MAEALLSPILEQLTRIVAQQVHEEVNLVGGVKKQVDKLKSNLIAIQSVLEDADRKQVKDKAVRDWLGKLKDACYDMDDVLDEWSSAILRWKMEEAEENTRSLQKMRCSFLKSPCFCLNQVVRRRDIALKIKEVCEKVDDIAKARAMYGFDPYRATDELQRITSTSLVDESIVTGRDDEREAVVSKLLGESIQEAEEWDGIERRVGEENANTTSISIMPQLRELKIHKCPLLRALPDYVLTASLQVFELDDCTNVEVLSLLGRLPNLESLVLRSMKVRRLDVGFLGIEKDENASINEGEIARVTAFPKLKELDISCLEEVEEWDGIERIVGEEDANTTSIISIMPQLRYLEILNCPLLRALPDYVLAAPLHLLNISG